MRFRTVTHSVVASMLVAAVGVFAAAAPASAAGVTDVNSVTLPMASYADIQVNAQRNEVYVAGGDQIVIADLDGNPLQTIGGQSGVYGLALNADGTKLYAALRGGHAVSVIDTKRKREVKRYNLGSACPGDLAFGGGKLWFSAACTQGSIAGSVGTIDLNSGAVTTHLTGLQAVLGLPLLSFAVRDGWPTKLVVAARDMRRPGPTAGGCIPSSRSRPSSASPGPRSTGTSPNCPPKLADARFAGLQPMRPSLG
ncbi:hypothetical protein ABZ807_32015 [Micromonospora sp. NPDC047548]|uniref:YncE family protein n=1 Tax=Micromonospora sp. NPDC047548 TaxID=3155624 RepID=UPI0033E76100